MSGRVGSKVGGWFAVLFVVVIVYVLVRNDHAADFIADVGALGKALVRAATDTAK